MAKCTSHFPRLRIPFNPTVGLLIATSTFLTCGLLLHTGAQYSAAGNTWACVEIRSVLAEAPQVVSLMVYDMSVSVLQVGFEPILLPKKLRVSSDWECEMLNFSTTFTRHRLVVLKRVRSQLSISTRMRICTISYEDYILYTTIGGLSSTFDEFLADQAQFDTDHGFDF